MYNFMEFYEILAIWILKTPEKIQVYSFCIAT